MARLGGIRICLWSQDGEIQRDCALREESSSSLIARVALVIRFIVPPDRDADSVISAVEMRSGVVGCSSWALGMGEGGGQIEVVVIIKLIAKETDGCDRLRGKGEILWAVSRGSLEGFALGE